MLIDGSWSRTLDNEYKFKMGNTFLGSIARRGGNGIYANCWVVSLNGRHLTETTDDIAYAQAWVERAIVEEMQRIAPTYRMLKNRIPPIECFHGPDTLSRWRNWKHDNAPEMWRLHPSDPKYGQLTLDTKRNAE